MRSKLFVCFLYSFFIVSNFQAATQESLSNNHLQMEFMDENTIHFSNPGILSISTSKPSPLLYAGRLCSETLFGWAIGKFVYDPVLGGIIGKEHVVVEATDTYKALKKYEELMRLNKAEQQKISSLQLFVEKLKMKLNENDIEIVELKEDILDMKRDYELKFGVIENIDDELEKRI